MVCAHIRWCWRDKICGIPEFFRCSLWHVIMIGFYDFILLYACLYRLLCVYFVCVCCSKPVIDFVVLHFILAIFLLSTCSIVRDCCVLSTCIERTCFAMLCVLCCPCGVINYNNCYPFRQCSQSLHHHATVVLSISRHRRYDHVWSVSSVHSSVHYTCIAMPLRHAVAYKVSPPASVIIVSNLANLQLIKMTLNNVHVTISPQRHFLRTVYAATAESIHRTNSI